MINSVPTPPFEHSLNMSMQTVMTVGTWGLTLFFVIKAIKMSRQQNSLLPIFIILAGAAGSIAEPLYDIAFHLIWYIPGQWSLFTAFGLPQPVWVMSAYIIVFCGPALYITEMLHRGMNRQQFYKTFAIVLATTAVFEAIAINGGTYAYYGPQPLRLLNYPVWVAILEAVFIMSFSIAAALLRCHATSKRQHLLVFALFPCTFFFANFGTGFPSLIALNSSSQPSMALIYACFAVTLLLVVLALELLCLCLPATKTQNLTLGLS